MIRAGANTKSLRARAVRLLSALKRGGATTPAQLLEQVEPSAARDETVVFLSYAREDEQFVRRLHDALAKANRGAWVDWTGIPPTADWIKEIHAAIESADAFAAVITPDSVASAVCQREIEHAAKHNKRLIPLLRRAAALVPSDLANLNWLFFREGDDFDKSFAALLDALDTDLAWVRAHTRLLVRAIEWQSSEHDKSSLLRGADLKAAEGMLVQEDKSDPRPTALQVQYVVASRNAETRRQRFTLGGVGAALVVTAALGITAWIQRNQAFSRELAASSISQLGIDPELSLLLGLEAFRTSHTAQAEDALRRSLRESHV